MEKQIRTYEEEVSLKEIILILIKGWKFIVGGLAIFGILASIYLFFIAKPVYESVIDGVISIPEEAETRYGIYPFPTQNPNDYLEVVFSDQVIRKLIHKNMLGITVNDYRDKISIKQEKDASRFEFKLKSNTAEQSKQLLEELSVLFLKEINYQYKLNALGYFETLHRTNLNKIGAERETISKTLKEYEKLLGEMDRTIPLKKLVLSDPVYAAEIAKDKSVDIKNLSDSMMLEEYVNPNYEALELQITDLKKNYASLDIQEAKYQKYLNEIKSERALVSKFLLGDHEVVMEEGVLEVLRPHIIMSEAAVLPEKPVAPRKIFGLGIALVFGMMIGIFVALFSSYWKKESEVNKMSY